MMLGSEALAVAGGRNIPFFFQALHPKSRSSKEQI
jgi:hypothetical protein